MLKTDFTKEQRFLLAKKAEFTKQMQADLAAGKVRFIDSDVQHIAEISEAGGIYDLLRTTNDKTVGVSDFDSNKLEAGVNVAVGRIKIAYGKDASANKTAPHKINFSSDIAAFPPELLRAKMIVKQDNKTLLRLPIERFCVSDKTSKVQGEEDVLHLGTPFVLFEQKPVNIQLEFNPEAGIIAGADDHFLQVRLMGTETAAR
jgi:hypothetical protein